MAQLKIYGQTAFLRESSTTISDALQRAAVTALGLPRFGDFRERMFG